MVDSKLPRYAASLVFSNWEKIEDDLICQESTTCEEILANVVYSHTPLRCEHLASPFSFEEMRSARSDREAFRKRTFGPG